MEKLNEKIFFYDDDCGMCNKYVIFILESNPKNRIKFAPLNSDLKNKLIGKTQIDSSIFYDSGKIYYEALAIINSIKYTESVFRFLHYLNILHPNIINKFYRIIAKKRKLVFKNYDKCLILSSDQKKLFIK